MIGLRHLRGDRRGVAAVLVAGALPMLIGSAAIAVDIGMVQLERRRLQGVADVAALAAARELDRAGAAAARLVAANPGNAPVTATATVGRYDPVTERFTAGGAGADAARVVVSTEVPTLFAAAFGTRAIRVERRATARRVDMAGIAIGTRLASVEGGIANALLGALTGGQVALSVMDYRALADARVDLIPWLRALGADARLTAVTHDEVLQTELPAATVLGSLADNVADPAASAALRALATASKGAIRLSDLFGIGDLGRQATGGEGLVQVSALQLASNVLLGSGHPRQIAIDLGAQVPGLARTRLWVAVGERPNRSPWITLARDNSVVVRTAQTRAYLEARLQAQPLPGLSLASAELPVLVELASGEARLEAIECGAPRHVDIAARPSPGLVALARIDPAALGDFTRAVPQQDARFLETLLVRVEGRGAIDLGAAEPFQTRRFDAAMIATGTPQTVSSGQPVGGVASSLVRTTQLRGRLLGLIPIPLDPVVQGVGSQLSLVAPALDSTIASLTGMLGVGVGQADVWATGLRCGQPVLVE